MNFITVDATNISCEHIGCATTDKKGSDCVASKKLWMQDRFSDGLVFRRLDARGKVLIEYIPAEKAWYPIEAENYMHINCFWVAGQFKGKGYGSQLLEQCITDSKEKGKYGLIVLSSSKKMPFLSDPQFLKHKGFFTADTAAPYYELLYLPFKKNAPVPKFKECAKLSRIEEQGLVLYYSNGCTYTEKYASLISKYAEKRNVPFQIHKFTTTEQAQNAPSPFTIYSLFYNGKFITNTILSESALIKLLDKYILP